MLDDIDDDIPTLIEHDLKPEGSASESRTDAGRRVPLTIISGFLGAGKSTLLKRILTENHGYRIAVIMNDFGDTADIESRTINVSSATDPTSELSEEFLELANGCLCCSIKDSGIASIEKLMRRKGGFDYILLETTGLADPGPIASMFWQNEDFSRGSGTEIALDGVVCVVDAVFGQKQIEEDHAEEGIGESLRQIAAADVILLNKVDLASASQLQALEELLYKINPAIKVHRTVQAVIDLQHVISINAYASGPSLRQIDQSPHIDHASHDHDPDVPHTHDTHYEVRGITSLQLSCPVLSPGRQEKLDDWIRSVLWEHVLLGSSSKGPPLEVLRCKGIFTADSGQKYVLQGVRSMYEIAPVEIDDLGELQEGKLVFIGKGLNDAVRASFQQLFS